MADAWIDNPEQARLNPDTVAAELARHLANRGGYQYSEEEWSQAALNLRNRLAELRA